MKFSKFLPLAVATMMLVTPAFAESDASSSATAQFDLTLPSYVRIVKNAASNETATATIGGNYTTLTFDNDLVAKFDVTTNTANTHVQLTGRTTETGGEQPALYGTDAAAMQLVFAQETATAGTVVNTMADGTNSPNAIAFTVNFVGGHSGAATADPSGTLAVDGSSANGKVINYTLNNGEYTFTYTITGADIANNSFDTKDTAGHYKAKLTLSYITP